MDRRTGAAIGRASPGASALSTFGLGVAGLLFGHAVSYLLAIPDPHHRDLVLRGTGHGYLYQLNRAGVILLLAAVVAVVVRGSSQRRTDAAESFAPLAAVLAGAQVAAFVGQEVGERLIAGWAQGAAVHGRVLAIGVPIQLVLGLGEAAILRWLGRASSAMVEVLSGFARTDLSLRPGPVFVCPAGSEPARRNASVSPRWERAPPPA